MQKVKKSRRNSCGQNKVCLRMVAVVIAVILATSAFMTVSAAAPETGYTTLNTTVYSALDAVTGSGSSAVFSGSDESSVWKFAVGETNNPFKKTDASFAALSASPVENGVEFSWQKSDAAFSTLFITDGGSYQKSFSTAADSLVVTDLEIGKTYRAQVTSGEKSSAVLTYNNYMLGANSILRSDLKETGDFNIQSGNNRFFIDLGSSAADVNANGALIFKINTEMLPEKAIAFDTNLGTNKSGEAYPSFSSNDAWVGISSWITAADLTYDEKTGEITSYTGKDKNKAISKTGANSTIIIDDVNSKKTVTKAQPNTNGVSRDWYKGSRIYQGYVIIPFDNYTEDTLNQIKENGYVHLLTESYRYFHQYYNVNGNSDYTALTANNTSENLDEKFADESSVYNTNNKDFTRVFDRQFTLSDVCIIPDYQQFVDNCIGADNIELSSVSETAGITYLSVYANISGDITEITSSAVQSKYRVYTKNLTEGHNVKFVAAAGEKMELGFTAPQAGTYEIAVPISADAADGIHYGVIKLDANGNRSIVEAEREYAGENGLCNTLIKLSAGDTVYIEAYSDTDGAVIDMGNPQFIRLNTAENGEYTFRAVDYLERTLDNGRDYSANWNSGYTEKTNSVWQAGYFVNPVVKDEEGTITSYDGFGLADMSENSDASKLVSAFTPYKVIRAGNENIFYPEMKKSNGALETAGWNGYAGGMAPVENISNKRSNPTPALSKCNTIYAYFGYTAPNSKPNTNDIDDKNLGVYLKYIAPTDGTATLRLTGDDVTMGNSKTVSVVLINGTVRYVYNNTVAINTTVELGELRKGDEVALCFGTTAAAQTGINLGNPQITLKANLSSVTFDADVSDIPAGLISDGTVISLPNAARFNSLFRGWSNGTELLKGEYTVSGDVHFSPVFSYYGDVNGDDRLDAGDLGVYRKHLLGEEFIAEEYSDIADIAKNGEIDIIDLVRLKKFLALGSIELGVA